MKEVNKGWSFTLDLCDKRQASSSSLFLPFAASANLTILTCCMKTNVRRREGIQVHKEFLPVATDFGYLFHIWQLVELAANAALPRTASKASGWRERKKTKPIKNAIKSTFSEVFHDVKVDHI